MLPRLMKRNDQHFDRKVVNQIKKLDIKSLKQLLARPSSDIAADLNISVSEYEEIITKLCHILCPNPKTAFELYHELNTSLKTRITALDHALGGGIPSGSLTEFVGVAGTGKSTFCLLLSVLITAANKEASVIYIDTEHKFSIKRILEIMQHHVVDDNSNVLKRIHVISIDTFQQLIDQVNLLEERIGRDNVQLVIVDSIAALARKDFGPEELPQRQKCLTSVASSLKYLAGSFDIPVIVTNQATTRMDDTCAPALGNSWAHCVNTRIAMEQRRDQSRFRILKSPVTGEVQVEYSIQDCGIAQVGDDLEVKRSTWTY